jgi:serine/threonine-protein kinase
MEGAIQPGTVLSGKYRVDAVIGAGGMGMVVRARQIDLDRDVAIKMLQPEFREKKDAVERFYREAKAAARIRGEHVAQIIEVAKTESGEPYLVMEYLEGEDLASVMRREGSLSLELAVTFMLHACSAVADAHAARIIHRDLKPANLFLAKMPNGTPVLKVLDFGISRIDDQASKLTHTQTSLGTAFYMSPEQIEKPKSIDARIDVWALGCIFHEFLTGEPPFAGESLPQIVSAVLRNARKKPSEVVADLPAGVDAVVDRCLQSEPTNRFPSVAELAASLAELTNIPEHTVIAGKLKARAESLREITVSDPHKATAESAPKVLALPIEPEKATAPTAMAIDVVDSVLSLTDIGGKLSETPSPSTQGSAQRDAAPPKPPPAAMMPTMPAPPSAVPVAPPVRPPPRALELEEQAESAKSANDAPSKPSEEGVSLESDGAPPQRRVMRFLDLNEEAAKQAASMELQDAPKKVVEKTEKKRRPILKWVAGSVAIVGALVAAVVFLGPSVAASRVEDAAARAGITMTHDPPQFTIHGWELRNINAKFANIPTATAHIGTARASWTGDELLLLSADVSSQGTVDEFERALSAFDGAAPLKVEVVDIRWKHEPRRGLKLEGGGTSFIATRGPRGRDVQFLSPRTHVTVNGMELGPFGLNLERTWDTDRARIALDPVVPDGPSIIIVRHGGVVHVGGQAARAPLARYGIPAAFIGLPAGDNPDIEFNFDASQDEHGAVIGQGSAAIYGMKVGPSAPVDAVVPFAVDGVSTAIHLKAPDSRVGPFPSGIRGEWSRSSPSKVTFTFTTAPVPCGELVRALATKQTNMGGIILAEIAKFTGAIANGGAVTANGILTVDLDVPPKMTVAFASTDTCGLKVFPK